MLNEGAATQGVWLPLALAGLTQWLIAIVRMFGSDETRLKVPMPKTSEILKSWALPFMAKAVREGEAEAEAEEMTASLERLKERFGRE